MHLHTLGTKLGWKIAGGGPSPEWQAVRAPRWRYNTCRNSQVPLGKGSQFIELKPSTSYPPRNHYSTSSALHQRLPESIPEMQIAALLSDLKSLSACVCHVASIPVTSHLQSLSCTLLIPPPCPAHLPEALGSRLGSRPSDGPPHIPATNSTKPRPYYYSVAIEDG